jgi:large subunit ribosomal protein L10
LSLNRSEKEAVINEVTSLAAKAQTLVIAEYRGITVADMTKLRRCAQQGCEPERVEEHPGPPCCCRQPFDVVATR